MENGSTLKCAQVINLRLVTRKRKHTDVCVGHQPAVGDKKKEG